MSNMMYVCVIESIFTKRFSQFTVIISQSCMGQFVHVSYVKCWWGVHMNLVKCWWGVHVNLVKCWWYTLGMHTDKEPIQS